MERAARFWLKILPKPGKTDYTTVKSYRPISLINSLPKIADAALVNRFKTILMTEELSILRTNVAYISGMSVHDIIRNLLNNLNIAKKKKYHMLHT